MPLLCSTTPPQPVASAASVSTSQSAAPASAFGGFVIPAFAAAPIGQGKLVMKRKADDAKEARAEQEDQRGSGEVKEKRKKKAMKEEEEADDDEEAKVEADDAIVRGYIFFPFDPVI